MRLFLMISGCTYKANLINFIWGSHPVVYLSVLKEPYQYRDQTQASNTQSKFSIYYTIFQYLPAKLIFF